MSSVQVATGSGQVVYDIIVYQQDGLIRVVDATGNFIVDGPDATEIIQIAIDATPNNGVLYIGPGKYSEIVADIEFVLNASQTVYTAFLITDAKNIRICGAGVDTTTLELAAGQHAIGHPAIMFLNRQQGEIDNGYTSFEISDMTLDGNRVGQADWDFDGAALILTGSVRSGGKYHDLKLQNYIYGLYSGNNGSGPEDNLFIDRVVCENMYRDGIQVDTVKDSIITNVVAKFCNNGLNVNGNTDYLTRPKDGVIVNNVICIDSSFAVWRMNDATISNVTMNIENGIGLYGLSIRDSQNVRFSNSKFIGSDVASGGKLGKATYITVLDGPTIVEFSDCYFSAYNALQLVYGATAKFANCTFRGTNACIYLRDIDSVTCAADMFGCNIVPVGAAKKWDVASGAKLALKYCFVEPATENKTEEGTITIVP